MKSNESLGESAPVVGFSNAEANNQIINQTNKRTASRNSANIMWSRRFRHKLPLGEKSHAYRSRRSSCVEVWIVIARVLLLQKKLFFFPSTATPSTFTREIHNYGLTDATKALVFRLISQFWLTISITSEKFLFMSVTSNGGSLVDVLSMSEGFTWKVKVKEIKFEFPIPGLSHQMKIYSHKLTPDAVWVTEHRQSRSNGH